MKFEIPKEKLITIVINEDKTINIHKDKRIFRKDFEMIIKTIFESLYDNENC